MTRANGLSTLKRAARLRSRGAVSVEIAIAFPLLLLVFMVMMFFMDLIMVKQEITTAGFAAMRECANQANRPACVLGIIAQTQQLSGSNNRYECDASPAPITNPDGTVIQVVDLNCEYQGLLLFDAIVALGGPDNLREMTNIRLPVFFPEP